MAYETGEHIAGELGLAVRDGSILGVPASVLMHFSIDHEIPKATLDQFQRAVNDMTPDQRAALNGTLQSEELAGNLSNSLRARFCSAATFLHQLELAILTDSQFTAMTGQSKDRPYQPSLFDFAV